MWLPRQPWFAEGESTDLVRVGSFRFDDPEGEVGVETLLLASKGAVFQVPLTYRDSPLDGANAGLIGTTEHSVLGTRWVYDAARDPVYASTLATTILSGQPQAEQLLDVDGHLELIAETVQLQGSGIPGTGVPAVTSAVPETVGCLTTIHTGHIDLLVSGVLDLSGLTSGQKILTATWAEQSVPVQLASAVVV
ncbi:hypothetical protein QFZ30_003246 [Arthrobacter pascens]|uniref:maltokinase N-terminal cap-like domain-containing protein n=1 Tax=Arthrobacter pascens TaxID=1677 RepID=UPI00279405CA|nr:hypothetical protein [Arthrobacter pascens]MDQ0679864.1 hypothetical protein [Arthrobacter pascens]